MYGQKFSPNPSPQPVGVFEPANPSKPPTPTRQNPDPYAAGRGKLGLGYGLARKTPGLPVAIPIYFTQERAILSRKSEPCKTVYLCWFRSFDFIRFSTYS